MIDAIKDIFSNAVFVAIVAHGLIGISLVWDKILLRKPHMKDVVNYVFWLGAMSVFGCILAFFGMHLPPLGIIFLALGAGFIHLIANYYYYAALKSGEASQTLAIMGGFSPLATVLIGIPLLSKSLGGTGVKVGFALMVLGGFFMFFSEKINVKKIIPLVLMSSGLFGLTNVLQKVAFNASDFISAYVFFTIGTFGGALFFLVRKKWREEIFTNSEETPPSSRFWYFVNRFVSGVGSFLIFLAISQGSPAIVDAISGIRYAIIFIGAFLVTKYRPRWLCEEFHGWTLTAKAIATGFVIAGLIVVGLAGKGSGGSSAGRHETFQAAAAHTFRWRVLEVTVP